MKNKLLTTLYILISFSLSATAEIVYDDLTTPRNPSYRIGSGSKIEKEYKVKNINTFEEQKAKYRREVVKNKSYADSTLADLSNEIAKIVESDREILIQDIAILWPGAAAKSETVKFTIYKLSNPDADKPDEGVIKRVIRPLAGLSSVAGAGFMNPIAATSAIMSGTLLNSLTVDDKELNYKYTKVTDADMIMLLKRVDDLQKKLINQYIDYMTALNAYEKITISVNNRYQTLKAIKPENHEQLLIADAYYRSALEKKKNLELNFLSKRAALEQTAGVDALYDFEKVLKERGKL